MFTNVLVSLLSLSLLWLGSGIAVSAVTKISRSLRMSSFFISFFVLGAFTSLTEIMVGLNSLLNRTPEVFVGNLIGSAFVIMLFIVPLLAVIANGISLNHSFRFKDLVSASLVIGLPAFLTLDNKFGSLDAMLCLIIYGHFAYLQARNSGYLERLQITHLSRKNVYMNLVKIILAIAMVFAGSNLLVTQVTDLGLKLGVSSYLISILLLSVGTNIPEISIAIRAILLNKKDVAFGNYLGSATFNTLIIGTLSLISRQSITADGSNYSIIAALSGLAIFLFFARSRSNISRIEGLILLMCYLAFVLFEITTGPGWKITNL